MLYVVFITETALTLLIVAMGCSIIALIGIFVSERLEIYYRHWKIKRCIQQLDKAHEVYLQQKRKRELHEIEKRKYPLFYLKDGIV